MNAPPPFLLDLQDPYDLMAYAARNGDYEQFVLGYKRELPWTEETMTLAAFYGHDELIAFGLKHDCPVDFQAVEAASSNGYLECLKLLLEHNVMVSDASILYPIMYGYLDVLIFLDKERECNYIDKMELLCFALQYGHYEIVQYLLKKVRPEEIGVGCYLIVCKYGHLSCLELLYEKQKEYEVRWSREAVHIAASFGHLSILYFCLSNNCPYSLEDLLSLDRHASYIDLDDPMWRRFFLQTHSLEALSLFPCMTFHILEKKHELDMMKHDLRELLCKDIEFYMLEFGVFSFL